MKPMSYILVILACLLPALVSAQTQYKWDGDGGSDDSWGTVANWTNTTAPAASYSGRIVFTNLNLGNTNKLESDRTVTGSSGSTTAGILYNVNAQDGTAGHITDLNGYTLTINGGSLQVGYNVSNSLVRITNGTLKLGAANRPDVYVGQMTVNRACSNVSLTVSGTLLVTNCGSIHVGRQTVGNGGLLTPQGTLDLAGATINRGTVLNTLYLFGTLSAGQSSGDMDGANPFGVIKMPSSLKLLDVQDMIIGYLRDGYGTLDFGSSSSLTGLTVRGSLSLARESARGRILNLPPNLVIRIGSAGAPGVLHMSTYQYDPLPIRENISVTWIPTGGTFNAYLSELVIGRHFGGNQGTVYGKLDLTQTSVQFGGVPNQVKVPFINIGSRDTVAVHYGGGRGEGYLRLPASVTNITAGTLAVGYCINTRGWIDIGNPSSLKTILVTNAFLLGVNGRIGRDQSGTVVDYLPPAVSVQVGLATRYIKMHVGVRGAGQYPAYGETYGSGRAVLRITNGTFRAYLSELKVGTKEDSTKVVTGIVDVARATVSAFEINGHASIGAEKGINWGGNQSSNQNGKGYVYLPTCTVNVASNIYLGDDHASSGGFLSLNGSKVRVTGLLEINTTGVVTTRVNGASAGVELLSSDTNKFIVASAGRIKLNFTSNPLNPAQVCWGLKMAGNVTNYFKTLTNAPSRLTWVVAGLHPGLQPMVKIRYDDVGNYTYVGIPRMPRGSVFCYY